MAQSLTAQVAVPQVTSVQAPATQLAAAPSKLNSWTCAQVACRAGAQCVDTQAGALCVRPTNAPASNTLGASGVNNQPLWSRANTRSVPTVNGPCDLVRCASGTSCKVVDDQAQCVAPVNPYQQRVSGLARGAGQNISNAVSSAVRTSNSRLNNGAYGFANGIRRMFQ